MKTALFFNDKDAQLVLTADTKWEKTMLEMLHENYPEISFVGEFYDCNGGWVRMKKTYPNMGYQVDSAVDSLMIRMPRTKGAE